ncbi:Metallo-dependent phosphatase [Artomyces pyxidatus]|uniref:Metallo-dependent phosphatase n=1 Tax=Artomyces pyxidatus TaxID=48021 RepID=A0ACB8T5S6_9AGAM|nr:Metallo-dependent phosphatase [Artomyces pyxidatus]
MAGLTSPLARKVICFVWIIAILLSEIGFFFSSTNTCTWPDPKSVSTATDAVQHVLIVADPQILDEDSYPGRNKWLMALSVFVVDMNLRKSWRVVKHKQPDAIVFLGDMMDNGRANTSSQQCVYSFSHSVTASLMLACLLPRHQAYLERFRHIFSAPRSLPVYYTPGNHDVGLGHMPDASSLARLRYKTAFGPLNQHIFLANHSIALIDAPALVDDDRLRASSRQSDALPRELQEIQFIRSLNNAGDKPLILFSHIPLTRPYNADCGPLREKGHVDAGSGYGYENTLSPETSNMLLKTFRPSLIFSGDDHDYCEYRHELPTDRENPTNTAPRTVLEVTVKSFSMAMGIRRPGFHLLSLAAPEAPAGVETFAHRPCVLPDQIKIYLGVYVPLLVLTLIAVVYLGYMASDGVAPMREKRDGSIERKEGSPRLPLPASASTSSSKWRSHGQPGIVRRVWGEFYRIAWPPLLLYGLIVLMLFW